MTPEEINCEIALACGWRWDRDERYWESPRAEDKYKALDDVFPPDYFDDLNAMHEAEKLIDGLPTDERSLWLDYLASCCNWPHTKNAAELRFEVQYLQARATAAQRAEAFLRTLGKWRDA